MNIGFIINFSKNDWLGGYNYYLHLIESLEKFSDKKIKPIIIFDKKKRVFENKEFKKYSYKICSYFSNSNKYLRIFNKLLIIIFGKSFLYEKFLKENNINIVSHSFYVGKNSYAKSFPWFPDFQEYFFPNNFNKKSIFLRKLNLFLATHHSEKILVSSKSTLNDLQKISNFSFKKAEILFHTNKLLPSNKILSEKRIRKKYSIKKNFFLLPNHYWVHKNHSVVLKAINSIYKKNFQIISTGKKLDHRDPKYFKNFTNLIKRKKLQPHYRILGIVPESDLYSLMSYSLGIINPSKFEGWGNSAAKAISLEKPAILSNIGPHKELKNNSFSKDNKKKLFFFNPNDYLKLARILNILSKKKNNKKNYHKLLVKNEEHTKTFIKNYLKIINI